MKKYSNEPIPQIVDLGDNRYEFCFNHASEVVKNDEGVEHTSYDADIVTCEGSFDRQIVIAALVEDGKTREEAEELTECLVQQ